MTTAEIIVWATTIASIAISWWSARSVARWAAARYGISEKVAGNVFGFFVFIIATCVWVYFDIWTVLESHGIPVER